MLKLEIRTVDESFEMEIQKYDVEQELIIGFVDGKRRTVKRSDCIWPEINSVAEATKCTGGLSKPSKMPGMAYSIPAKHCITGSALRKRPGTVCSVCYAFRGNYPFPVVQNAMERRFGLLEHPLWVDGMVYLIKSFDNLHFRWHDSGDIQSVNHLLKICRVAVELPQVRFWLPTKEKAILTQCLEVYGPEIVPENLCVRLSATMVGAPPLKAPMGINTSTVVKSGETCPARSQNNNCGICRDCWDRSVRNVSYKQH